MCKANIDDYLQKGLYGEKQTKPEERRRFLGTLRERIVVALKKGQVMEQDTYSELEVLMKKYPDATLYLNGDIRYSFLTGYIQLAKKCNNAFSIVTNSNHATDIGLVLALDYAIHIENIFNEKQTEKKVKKNVKTKKQVKKNFFLKKLFKK